MVVVHYDEIYQYYTIPKYIVKMKSGHHDTSKFSVEDEVQ